MSAAPQVFPRAGEEIGPFRITRRLGGGGMGVVYAARPSRSVRGTLDRDVALKVIAPHLADNRDFRVRFAREARAMAALESGNVVHVYTFGEDHGRLYIASQLIPGGDLDTALRAQGGAPLGLAIDLMAQVAAGLADAHLAGLVHRDIKPANVLLRRRTDGFDAYLGGFGASPAAGTALDADSDIQTMGWLLWTTATGWPPYSGPFPQLAGDSPQVQSVNRILRTALAADPAARYPSAAALRDDLRYARSLPGPSWLVAAPAAVSRRRSGALALVAGLVAALVLGVGGAVWAGILIRDRQPAETAPASLSAPAPAPPTADERRAVSNIANAFGGQLFVGPTQAQCIAQGWVDTVGLDALTAAGFLDADMNFYDQDLETVDPALGSALGDATAECLG